MTAVPDVNDGPVTIFVAAFGVVVFDPRISLSRKFPVGISCSDSDER
jgi:hypothetical protein